MSMKEAFDVFFEEIVKNWLEKRGRRPQIPCRPKDREKYGVLIVDDDSNQGNYVCWKPQLQTKKIDFEKCEEILGYEIHPQIKEYVSTYWFVNLEGVIYKEGNRISLQLNAILPNYNMEQYIVGSFDNRETHYLIDEEYFLIGTYCSYCGDDSYLVHVDNKTGCVYIVQVIEQISIKIADSIEELLNNMKGIWS